MARRVHGAFTASLEKLALVWMAERAPAWVTSDGLTLLGLGAQIGAGVCYALARWDRRALLGAIACIALNWLGDSRDGTLARVRQQQRPRYGFYVDHMVDVFGAVALMGGLAEAIDRAGRGDSRAVIITPPAEPGSATWQWEFADTLLERC